MIYDVLRSTVFLVCVMCQSVENFQLQKKNQKKNNLITKIQMVQHVWSTLFIYHTSRTLTYCTTLNDADDVQRETLVFRSHKKITWPLYDERL